MEVIFTWATFLFLALFGGLMAWKHPEEEVVEPILFIPEPPKPVEKTRREKFYDYAYQCLGQKKGLDRSIPKEVNCANALSHVLIGFGVSGLPIKGIASSATLDRWFAKSPGFEKVSEPQFGDIISSPTGSGNGKIRGHVGVVGKHQIMSNNSRTGLWQSHWTLKEWIDYYQKYGGLKTNYYRLLSTAQEG
ncbi:hypothetical protein C4568_03580 [Candidatus Parcubacteria bacterium]|nr:MAG: hypothetical protein C4568_03580 [Candidatus Parcubacteria bacterium]